MGYVNYTTMESMDLEKQVAELKEQLRVKDELLVAKDALLLAKDKQLNANIAIDIVTSEMEKVKNEVKAMIMNVPKETLDYAELVNNKKKHGKLVAKLMRISEISDIQYIDYLHELGVTKYDYLKDFIANGMFSVYSHQVGISSPFIPTTIL